MLEFTFTFPLDFALLEVTDFGFSFSPSISESKAERVDAIPDVEE